MNPAGTTASNRPDMGWFIGSFALSVFTMMVFPCICGHLQTEALPTSILGAAFAWFPFIRYKRTRIFDRWFTLFLVLFSTLILIKNIADILWFGHESLLR